MGPVAEENKTPSINELVGIRNVNSIHVQGESIEHASAITGIRWQYHTEIFPYPPGEQKLNELGKLGWELVTIERNGDRMQYLVYFKRAVTED
jgi:hypothetical protein